MGKTDILIAGGGPAGLAAAQYAARAGLGAFLCEAAGFGGQALEIDSAENYPGNAACKSGSELAEDFRVQAERFGASLENTGIASLKKTGNLFEAELEDGRTVNSGAVILATGAARKLLGVPGEETFAGRGVSYCAGCDGPFFRGKKIFVAGGGDAACDEARFLSKLSPSVTILVRRGAFGAQKALADRVLNTPGINVLFNERVAEIKGEKTLSTLVIENTETGERREERADALFVLVGILPRTELVLPLGPELDANGFVITDAGMQSSVPGLFAAGDVRSSPFRQVVTAAADGAVAAHAAAAYIMSGAL